MAEDSIEKRKAFLRSQHREVHETPVHVRPKFQDAEEVERLGLMKVPKRYTYEEAKAAIAAGKEVIARSEHPGEAEGLSGINPSYVFSPENPLSADSEELDFLTWMFTNEQLMGRVDNFCKENSLDARAYKNNLTWSFWEFIPGINMSVVEDTAVKGRYNVLAEGLFERKDTGKSAYTQNVFTVEGDAILSVAYDFAHIPQELTEKVSEITSSYERLKRHFGSHTAWITEIQLGNDGELYFLQRHPTRPYEATTWRYEDEPLPTDLVVTTGGKSLVRGVTPQEGIECELIHDGYCTSFSHLPQQRAYSSVFSEFPAIYQKWISNAEFFLEKSGPVAGEARDPHSSVIPLTKPRLYVSAPDFPAHFENEWGEKHKAIKKAKKQARTQNARVWKEEGAAQLSDTDYYAQLWDYEKDPLHHVQLRIRVWSDGREARIRVLDVF